MCLYCKLHTLVAFQEQRSNKNLQDRMQMLQKALNRVLTLPKARARRELSIGVIYVNRASICVELRPFYCRKKRSQCHIFRFGDWQSIVLISLHILAECAAFFEILRLAASKHDLKASGTFFRKFACDLGFAGIYWTFAPRGRLNYEAYNVDTKS